MMASVNQKSVRDLQRELRELRQTGKESKMAYRLEVVNLQSNLTALNKALDDKAYCKRISLYRQAVRDVFLESDAATQEDGYGSDIRSLLPQPYVVKIQAQLVHSFHSNEIQKKQLQMMERHTKSLAKHLEKRKGELSRKNEDRKRVLYERLRERVTEWQQQLEDFRKTADVQEITMKELRRQLGVQLDSIKVSSPPNDVDPDMSNPSSSVHSLSASMRKIVEGVSIFKHGKIPSLDITSTTPQSSNSMFWIDLNRNKSDKQKLEVSFEELKALQGTLIQSDWSKQPFRSSSNNGIYMNDHTDGTSLVTSSVNSMETVGKFQKSTSLEFSNPSRIGSLIRRLMKGIQKEITRSESLNMIEEYTIETPTGEKKKLSKSEIGNSLLALVEPYNNSLSPTSKALTELSQEVFLA